MDRLTSPLAECGPEVRHAFVILGFGSVDIEWNLSYKRDVQKQDVNTDAFIAEMVETLAISAGAIVAQGERLRARAEGGPEVHILLSFPFVPMPLSDGYMEAFDKKYGGGNYRVISHEERCSLWSQFCDAAIERLVSEHPDVVRVADVRDDFARDGFGAYSCDEEDHHPQLARSQHAVAAKVRAQLFPTASGASVSLEPHEWPHDHMYPHVRRRFPPKEKKPVPASAPAAATEAGFPVAARPPAALSVLDADVAKSPAKRMALSPLNNNRAHCSPRQGEAKSRGAERWQPGRAAATTALVA